MDIMKDFKTNEQYYKYCYDYCKNVYYNEIKMKQLAKQLKLPVDNPIFLAKTYATEYLKMTEEEFEKEVQEVLEQAVFQHMEKRYMCDLFEVLRKEDNPDKIIEILKQYDNQLSGLKSTAYDYVITYRPWEKDFLIDSLREKIDIYLDYKKQQRNEQKQEDKIQKEQELLPVAVNIINQFINDNINKTAFCQKNNIDLKLFDDCVNLLNEYNKELYLKYKEKINEQQSNRYAIISENIKRIAECIKTGIVEENNVVRDFDILDYYSMTKLSFEELEKLSKPILNNDELRCIKTFITKNKNIKPLGPKGIEEIMSQKNIIGVEKDDRGNIIEGTGREITTEEKQQIINYLNQNSIPLNTKTYRVALRRYIDNKLFENEENLINATKKR